MIRAFHHPEQAAYSPAQSMRVGRVVAARDHGDRTERLLAGLAALGVSAERPPAHGPEPLRSVHTQQYLDFLATIWATWAELPHHGPEVWPSYFPYPGGRLEVSERPPCPTRNVAGRIGWFVGDLSAPIGPGTWATALRSADTALAAADALGTSSPTVYALCRPSGHHARADRAAGACYLNNAAIAVRRLLPRFARIAVLDVDVHHGDGTQQIFYGCDDVLTISIHADPVDAYPFFTGFATERGHGVGEGFNLNLPLARGSSGADFDVAMRAAVSAIERFVPDALILALGLDAHREDPVGLLRLETPDFARIGRSVRRLGLPTLVIQEGGYALEAIGGCLSATLAELA